MGNHVMKTTYLMMVAKIMQKKLRRNGEENIPRQFFKMTQEKITEDKLREECWKELMDKNNGDYNKAMQELDNLKQEKTTEDKLKDNANNWYEQGFKDGKKEAIKEIKDKWITYINNISYSKLDYRPLLSVGHIRDSFLDVLSKLKGEQNDN
jgi:hypothetical protein